VSVGLLASVNLLALPVSATSAQGASRIPAIQKAPEPCARERFL